MEETVSVASYLSPDSSRNEQCTLRILAQKGSPRRPRLRDSPRECAGRSVARAGRLQGPRPGAGAPRRPGGRACPSLVTATEQGGERAEAGGQTRRSHGRDAALPGVPAQLLVLTSLAPAADPVLEVSPSRTSAVIGVQASPLTSRSGGILGYSLPVCVWRPLEPSGPRTLGARRSPGRTHRRASWPCAAGLHARCGPGRRPALPAGCPPPTASRRPSFWRSEFSPCPRRVKTPQTCAPRARAGTSPSGNSGRWGAQTRKTRARA